MSNASSHNTSSHWAGIMALKTHCCALRPAASSPISYSLHSEVQCNALLVSRALHSFVYQPAQGRDEDSIENTADPAQENLTTLRRWPYCVGVASETKQTWRWDVKGSKLWYAITYVIATWNVELEFRRISELLMTILPECACFRLKNRVDYHLRSSF